MPPQNKASSKITKKGKVSKKRITPEAPVTSDSDWTSGGEVEEASVKSLLSNMTSMMAALNTRVDDMEDGWKKRKVAFHGEPPARRVAVPEAELGARSGLH